MSRRRGFAPLLVCALLLVTLWQESRKTVVFVTHSCFEACFVADRILILSPRPGRVRHEIPVDLPRPRNYDSPRLFELSVELTRLVLGAAPAA